MSVMFFVRDSDLRKTQIEYDAFQKKYADAVTAADLPSPEYRVRRARRKRSPPAPASPTRSTTWSPSRARTWRRPLRGRKAFADRRRRAARFTTEQNNGNLAKYGTAADVKVAPGSSLLDTTSRWTAIADKLISQREDKGQLDASRRATDAAAAAHVAALADKDKQIANTKADIAKARSRSRPAEDAGREPDDGQDGGRPVDRDAEHADDRRPGPGRPAHRQPGDPEPGPGQPIAGVEAV